MEQSTCHSSKQSAVLVADVQYRSPSPRTQHQQPYTCDCCDHHQWLERQSHLNKCTTGVVLAMRKPALKQPYWQHTDAAADHKSSDTVPTASCHPYPPSRVLSYGKLSMHAQLEHVSPPLIVSPQAPMYHHAAIRGPGACKPAPWTGGGPRRCQAVPLAAAAAVGGQAQQDVREVAGTCRGGHAAAAAGAGAGASQLPKTVTHILPLAASPMHPTSPLSPNASMHGHPPHLQGQGW